ncbi:MAG TPA: hypothetical protein VFS67_27630 [Polyangiaceae bacterium]|nr:hypothetical protein [Polyangiaceae bacterium]
MSTELPSFRVFRPLVGIVLTLLLVLLVAADRAFGGVHPLGLEPRMWTAIVFPIQIFSFLLYRTLRRYRSPRSVRGGDVRGGDVRGGSIRPSITPSGRFSSWEFGEVCAIALSVGYWFLTSEQLDHMLQPGWRVLVAGILLVLPLMAKAISERPGT